MSRLKHYYELTDDEKAVQFMHLIRKLRRALKYITEQMQDDLGHYSGLMTHSFSFGLQGVDPIHVEIVPSRHLDQHTIKVAMIVMQAPRNMGVAQPNNPNLAPLMGQEQALEALFEEFSPLDFSTAHDPCPYFVIAPRPLEA